MELVPFWGLVHCANRRALKKELQPETQSEAMARALPVALLCVAASLLSGRLRSSAMAGVVSAPLVVARSNQIRKEKDSKSHLC